MPVAELTTWSSTDGDPAAVLAWQTRSAARPWSAEDERFYRGILGGRTAGRYQLAADCADNVVVSRDRYGAHCVLWHFLAPVLFAHTALAERRRPVGKTTVLRDHPDPEVRHLLDAATADHPATTDTDLLLRRVTLLVDALPPVRPARTSDQDGGPSRADLVSALGVLRCRIARYSYYLNPPAGSATGYLVDREGKDLYAATAVLATAAPLLAAEPRGVIDRFLQLVPQPPTSRASLAEFLRRLRADSDLVGTLFSLPYGDLELSR